jgi:hypothetical protein
VGVGVGVVVVMAAAAMKSGGRPAWLSEAACGVEESGSDRESARGPRSQALRRDGPDPCRNVRAPGKNRAPGGMSTKGGRGEFGWWRWTGAAAAAAGGVVAAVGGGAPAWMRGGRAMKAGAVQCTPSAPMSRAGSPASSAPQPAERSATTRVPAAGAGSTCRPAGGERGAQSGARCARGRGELPRVPRDTPTIERAGDSVRSRGEHFNSARSAESAPRCRRAVMPFRWSSS